MINKESRICTDCLFLGTPSISIGRLIIEFFLNLFFPANMPIFEKVTHCPDCGKHTMVSVESEAGKTAITRLNEEGRNRPSHTDTGGSPSSSKIEEEILRSRLQR